MRLVPLIAVLLLTLLPRAAFAQDDEAEAYSFMATPYAGVFLEHLERAEGYSHADEPFLALAQLRSMMNIAGVFGLALMVTHLVRGAANGTRRRYLEERREMHRQIRTLHRHGYFPVAP